MSEPLKMRGFEDPKPQEPKKAPAKSGEVKMRGFEDPKPTPEPQKIERQRAHGQMTPERRQEMKDKMYEKSGRGQSQERQREKTADKQK